MQVTFIQTGQLVTWTTALHFGHLLPFETYSSVPWALLQNGHFRPTPTFSGLLSDDDLREALPFLLVGIFSEFPERYSILGYSARLDIFPCSMPKSIFSIGQEKLQSLLKQKRLNANLTQKELAQKLQRPQSFVSKYEIGERRLDLVELHQFCQALKIKLSDFAKEFENSLK